jgi:hypothetical protein
MNHQGSRIPKYDLVISLFIEVHIHGYTWLFKVNESLMGMASWLPTKSTLSFFKIKLCYIMLNN